MYIHISGTNSAFGNTIVEGNCGEREGGAEGDADTK